MMDEVYRLQFPSINDSISLNPNLDGNGIISININHQLQLLTPTQKNGQGLMEMSDVIIKAQIANHPLYPNLLSAYIDCRKVGAPPEMLSLLDEISKENEAIFTCTQIGTDPELDRFMESYCEVLEKYKEKVTKQFDEATNFLSTIQSQLTHLCNQTLPSITYPSLPAAPPPDNGGGPSDEGFSYGEMAASRSQECNNTREDDGRLKQMLMHKYSGYLSSLRKEFLKKRKKSKLPSEAIAALLEWWNTHYRWPYPTEEEKSGLSEKTGLDQKQINNWFINQRKRHWRPSEDMRVALMEDVGSMSFDATGGAGGFGI